MDVRTVGRVFCFYSYNGSWGVFVPRVLRDVGPSLVMWCRCLSDSDLHAMANGYFYTSVELCWLKIISMCVCFYQTLACFTMKASVASAKADPRSWRRRDKDKGGNDM
jgi:hypothetical protein